MQRKASGDEKILCTYTHPGHLTTPHPTALPPSSPIGCRHVTQNFSHYRRKRCRHIWSNLLLNVEFERTMNDIPRLIACVCMYVHCSAHGILNTPRKRGWLGAMGKDIKGWLTALPCTSHVATAGDNNRKNLAVSRLTIKRFDRTSRLHVLKLRLRFRRSCFSLLAVTFFLFKDWCIQTQDVWSSRVKTKTTSSRNTLFTGYKNDLLSKGWCFQTLKAFLSLPASQLESLVCTRIQS